MYIYTDILSLNFALSLPFETLISLFLNQLKTKPSQPSRPFMQASVKISHALLKVSQICCFESDQFWLFDSLILFL